MTLTAPTIPTREAATEQVTIARTAGEVEALRSAWASAAVGSIDADVDYLLTVVAHRAEALRPHVIRLERQGRADAWAIARVEDIALEARFGYRVLARPRVRCLFVVHGGLVGGDEPDDADRLLGLLDQALRDGEADVVYLSGVPAGGVLQAAAQRAVPRWRRDAVPQSTVRWTADIPDSADAFLKGRSKNTRENVRRYGKRFLRDHGRQLRVETFTDEQDLDRACELMEAVATLTYQRGLGVGFSASDVLQRELMRLGMRRGSYRAWVLSLDDRPVAFWDGQAYRGTFGIGSPGFDPQYAQQRVGTWLQMRMVEDLCADPAVSAIDYGAGDAQYKRSFGDECVEETDVLFFAKRPRALRAHLVRGVVAAAAAAGRRVVGDSELGRRIKRAWRRHGAG